MADEAGAHRILHDVLADRRKLLLVHDRSAPEALAEEMAPAAVTGVEALRVAAVQALETCGELGHCRLEDEVVVVRHQAERVEGPIMLPHDRAEQSQEDAAIVVVSVNRDLPGSPCSHVEVAVGEDVSRQARHRPEGMPRRRLQTRLCK